MKNGDRVIIESPGHVTHRKTGKIVKSWSHEYLGKLYAVAVPGFADISWSADRLRPVMRAPKK